MLRPIPADPDTGGSAVTDQFAPVELMFAAHLAAGLAIKSAQPKAPAWALLTGAFLPDLVWIVCSAAGIEFTAPAPLFDGWSHSLLSILAQALLCALLFLRLGRGVAVAIGCAVFSHFLLDLPIHPLPLELYPHSSIHLGWALWQWGSVPAALGQSRYWWVQLGVTLPLLAAYLLGRRRAAQPLNLAVASCVVVLGAHLLF
jgi:hypothetical protein